MLAPLALAVGLGAPALPPETGTRPGELRALPDSPEACGCHFDPEPGVAVEPGQSHVATAMALAARDPIFRAAFEVGRRDRPQLTQLCVRCHAPRGWLGGRGEGVLEALEPEDRYGVSCDVCHRMVVEDPPLIGSAQITIADSTAKRSWRGSRSFGGHGIQRSDDLLRSEACGTCHSLFNPAEEAHDHLGRGLGFPYYEQRTYEEWIGSAAAQRGEGCIHCHMRRVRGRATDGGPIHDDLYTHDIVGGNDFVARAVHLLEPELGLGPYLPSLESRVDANLGEAATVEILAPQRGPVTSGDVLEVQLRITNRTGHKLPTGYPEGRRVYLELAFVDPGTGEADIRIGAWDPATGDLVPHDQLVAYETVHGRVENGVSEPTHHLLLMNQVLTDSRIPPEGFVPLFEDMVPVGRDFGAAPPYRHYDEPRFRLEVPNPGQSGRLLILRARALYQVAHGEAMGFLLEETAGTPVGEDLARVWEGLDRAPPREMARAEVELLVQPAPEPADAGVAGPDLGRAPDREPAAPIDQGCRATGGSNTLSLCLLLAGLALFARRRGAHSPPPRSRAQPDEHDSRPSSVTTPASDSVWSRPSR